MLYHIKRNLEISKNLTEKEAILYFDEPQTEISLNGKKWLKIKECDELKKALNLLRYEERQDSENPFYIKCSRCGIKISDDQSILMGKINYCPHCFKYIKQIEKADLKKLFFLKIKTFYLRIFLIAVLSFFLIFIFYPFYYSFDIKDNNETLFNFSAESIAGNFIYKLGALDKRFEYKIKNGLPLNVISKGQENSNAELFYKENTLKIFSDSILRFEQNIDFKGFFYSMLPPRCNFDHEFFSDININILQGRILFKLNNKHIKKIKMNSLDFKIIRTPAIFFMITDLPDYCDTTAFFNTGLSNNNSDAVIFVFSGEISDSNGYIYSEGKEYRIDFKNKIKKFRDLSEIPVLSDELRNAAYSEKYEFSFNLTLTTSLFQKDGMIIPVFKNPKEQLLYAEKFVGHHLYKIAAFDAVCELAADEGIKEIASKRKEEIKQAYEKNKYENFFIKNEQ